MFNIYRLLLRTGVQFIQVSLINISYTGTLSKVSFIQEFAFFQVSVKTGFTVLALKSQ
jgi:hypothetical protein